ncbi:MAG TPA: ATP-binding protein [Patescibacteria group bacterium]|nr:ATP-binding protein [Patescibacteria group bacterium]
MFQKLRLRLTVINVAIILGLFFILSGGVYYLAQIDMTRHSNNLAQRLIRDIQTGRLKDLPGRNDFQPRGDAPPKFIPGPPLPAGDPNGGPGGGPPGPPEMSFFFVKTDTSGAITYQSSGQLLDTGSLARLVAQALQAEPEQGPLTLAGTHYTYFRAPLEDPAGTLLLFRDLTQEINMRQVLLTSLIVVSLVCALLSFGASFFLANRAMVPIQQAWQQQRNFLSDASHELRTPLAVIQTNLAVLRQNPEETVGSQSKWLDNIHEETACMAGLVDSLLFLARADSSQQPLNKVFLSFNTLLQRTVSPFEAVAAAKGVSLTLAEIAPLEGRGDETQLKQVFSILIDNAIRHTPAGGSIRLSAMKTADAVRVTVTDSGEGIPTEHLQKIFDRFYQVDTSRNKGGAGLGLAIARWIVENHDGSIAVTSIPGRKTSFIVEFPLVR